MGASLQGASLKWVGSAKYGAWSEPLGTRKRNRHGGLRTSTGRGRSAAMPGLSTGGVVSNRSGEVSVGGSRCPCDQDRAVLLVVAKSAIPFLTVGAGCARGASLRTFAFATCSMLRCELLIFKNTICDRCVRRHLSGNAVWRSHRCRYTGGFSQSS
jgi:hypothetical protein